MSATGRRESMQEVSLHSLFNLNNIERSLLIAFSIHCTYQSYRQAQAILITEANNPLILISFLYWSHSLLL